MFWTIDQFTDWLLHDTWCHPNKVNWQSHDIALDEKGDVIIDWNATVYNPSRLAVQFCLVTGAARQTSLRSRMRPSLCNSPPSFSLVLPYLELSAAVPVHTDTLRDPPTHVDREGGTGQWRAYYDSGFCIRDVDIDADDRPTDLKLTENDIASSAFWRLYIAYCLSKQWSALVSRASSCAPLSVTDRLPGRHIVLPVEIIDPSVRHSNHVTKPTALRCTISYNNVISQWSSRAMPQWDDWV
jgi:hypothetical protein